MNRYVMEIPHVEFGVPTCTASHPIEIKGTREEFLEQLEKEALRLQPIFPVSVPVEIMGVVMPLKALIIRDTAAPAKYSPPFLYTVDEWFEKYRQ